MLLTRLVCYCRVRRLAFLPTSLFQGGCCRLSHTCSVRHIKSWRIQWPFLKSSDPKVLLFTHPARLLSTGSHLQSESRTLNNNEGEITLDNFTELPGITTDVFPDEEDNPLPKTRKVGTPIAEYTLDEDGYMDIRDLVSFLKQESAIDICVIKATGNKRSYVEYLVVVSGVSIRHLRAMAKNLEQMFRGHNVRGIGKGGHVSVEGLDSDHWMAVDIGNIVVHFFLPEVRQVYELEKLWTLGPQYDDQFKIMLDEEDYLKATYVGNTWDSRKKTTTKSVEPVARAKAQ